MLASFRRSCGVKDIDCVYCEKKTADIYYFGYAEKGADVALCLECSKEFVRRIMIDICGLETQSGRNHERGKEESQKRHIAQSMLLSFYRDKHGADEKIQPLLDYLGDKHPSVKHNQDLMEQYIAEEIK